MKKTNAKKYCLKEINLILTFILFIILSFLCFEKSIIIQKEQNVIYEESGSPNYKIYLKDNDYYKQNYLDKDMSYIANLINYISINYNYKFISDTELNGEYYYKIVADLEIRNPKNNSLFYIERYDLSEEKIFPIKNEKEYIINETVDINYGYYNAIANNFEASYGVDTESNLIVSLELHRRIDGTLVSNSDINCDEKINLIIPLSEKTINLKAESLEYKNKNVVVSLNHYKIDDIRFLILALLFLGLALTVFIYLTTKTMQLNSKMNSYDKMLRKILRQYDRLIVNVNTMPNFKENNTIEVDSFYELLDAKDNIHNAIFYYEVTPHQKCYFYINNDNNFIVYTLKNSDLKK
ncbi:MAG: DUF5305 family protein [bacterium]|nr:DUF5305 family protein [bacterium]